MIQTTHQDQVLTITLNRPEVRNAFNDELIAQLAAALSLAGQDPAVRVVVLAAQGSVFCAGADLTWMRRMAGYSREQNVIDAAGLAEMLRLLYECPKPTIAKVQGDAFAGGVGLVAACDMAVCAADARFCLSEVKLGLTAAVISPYVLRAMGQRAAQRYLLTGQVFSAEQAHRAGLVHEVVAASHLDAALFELTQAFALASPDAVSACKKFIQHVADSPIDDSLREQTVQALADGRASSHGREGVQAFLDKRKASWVLRK